MLMMTFLCVYVPEEVVSVGHSGADDGAWHDSMLHVTDKVRPS